MKKVLIAAALAVAAFAVPAATAGATVSHTSVIHPKSLFCVGGTTVGPTDNWILAYEAGPYGSGFVSTDEEGIGGYWFADEDSDDVAVTLGACVTPTTDSGPDGVPVCPSKSGSNTNPEFYSFDTAQSMIQSGGAVLASAVGYAVAGDTNTIAGVNGVTYTIVCNPKGAATAKFLTLDGSVLGASTKAEDDAEFKAGIDAPNQDNTKDLAIFA